MRAICFATIFLTGCMSSIYAHGNDSVNSGSVTRVQSPPHPSFLKFESHRLVSNHEIRLSIKQPAGFHAAGPIDHTPAFSGHPYVVSLAAYTDSKAFLMMHAERVLDKSGASDYSDLDLYRLGNQDFRTRTQCVALTPEDVAEEHDLSFLASNGFQPTPAIYLRQLFVTTDDHNAEVVVTYGERLDSCEDSLVSTAFRDAFDTRLRSIVSVAQIP